LLWLIFALATIGSVLVVVIAFDAADVVPPHPAALVVLGVGVGAVIASIIAPISATWIWLGRSGKPSNESTPNRVA
jgi:hypothetical protein